MRGGLFIGLIAATALGGAMSPASAGAQEGSSLSVALLSEHSRRDELAAALAVELHPTIEEIRLGSGPIGADEAMAFATALDADFGVWVDLIGGGLAVRVADTLTWDVRSAPIAGDVEPATFAIITESLLGELLDPPRPITRAPRRVRFVSETHEVILVGEGSYRVVVRDRAPEPRTYGPSKMLDPGRLVLRFAGSTGWPDILGLRVGLGVNVLRRFRLTLQWKLASLYDGRALTNMEVELAHQLDVRHDRASVGVRIGPGMTFGGNEGEATDFGIDVSAFLSMMWEAGTKNALGFFFDAGAAQVGAMEPTIQLHTGLVWEVAP